MTDSVEGVVEIDDQSTSCFVRFEPALFSRLERASRRSHWSVIPPDDARVDPAEARAALGLSDTLVRLSPGCEHQKDLVADVVAGLDAIAAGREQQVHATA